MEWRLVVGDGRYEVSSDGRVRNATTKRELKLGSHPLGYKAIRHINPEASRTVHRLVAKAFIPNPENLPSVNHLNGDKTDNRIENLEWCSNSSNIQHAIDTGLNSSRGETHHYAKLTEEQAKRAIELRAEGRTLIYIANEIGTTFANVHCIVTGKSWKHLSRI